MSMICLDIEAALIGVPPIASHLRFNFLFQTQKTYNNYVSRGWYPHPREEQKTESFLCQLQVEVNHWSENDVSTWGLESGVSLIRRQHKPLGETLPSYFIIITVVVGGLRFEACVVCVFSC